MLWGLDYLRGYVTVELTGSEPERWLNALVTESVSFWRLQRVDALCLRLRLAAADLPTARRQAQRCMCDLRILNERSFRRSFGGLRHRIVLLVGAALCLAALVVLPNMIWTLDVSGCEQVEPERVLRMLERIGVGFGTWAPGLDNYRIKNEMLRLIPELRWISVNTAGGRAQVLVAERTQPEPVENKHAATGNLVACCDGMVERLSVRNGQAVCQAGDAVRQGQLLVSGVVDLERCTMQTLALGEVYAQTKHEITVVTPSERTVSTRTEPEGWCLYLSLGQKRIKICGRSGISAMGCDKMIDTKVLTLPGGHTLPLRLTLERYYQAERQPAALDVLSAQSMLEQYVDRTLPEQMIAGQMLSSRAAFSQDGDCFRLEQTAVCSEMIARSVPLPIFEQEDYDDGTDNQRGTG